jgi:hypothetical protein
MRILLVEDSPANQLLGLAVLEQAGHDVVVADNGLDALRAFQQQPFDLVLMDLHMPVMDGLKATMAIREWERPRGVHTPVVALTASPPAESRQPCLDAGMDDYFLKPYSAGELLDMIGRYQPRGAAPVRTEVHCA